MLLHPDRRNNSGFIIFSLWLLFPFFAFLANKTTSGAYLPVLFPSITILFALFFDSLLNKKLAVYTVTVIVVACIVILNSYSLIRQNYFANHATTFAQRLSAAKMIIKLSGGKKYNLYGKGIGSQFPSYTMNIAYLTWWYGDGPAVTKEHLRFVITDTNDQGVLIKKK